MTTRGIDYGLGRTNVDPETGIRYGVIHQNAVGEAWFDSSEPDYGSASCGECGNEAVEYDEGKHGKFEGQDGRLSCRDYACESCKVFFASDFAFSEECLGCVLDDGEYKATSDEQGDIFILKSPYFTRAQFCSPCAPGAVHLENPCDDGERGYCFGHDWFEGDVAPYPVYSVETGELVEPKKESA